MIVHTHITAPNQFIEAGGIHFAYRKFGRADGMPLILFGHFRSNMDNWDPAVTDGLGKNRPVILFSNQGIGLTSGNTPDTIEAMAADAILFIEALGLTKIDLFGFSMGGFITQKIILDRPELVRKMVLGGTGPEGGQDMQTYIPAATKAATSEVTSLDEFLMLFFTESEASKQAGRAFWKRRHERMNDLEPLTSVAVMQAQGNAIGQWGIPNSNFSNLHKINQPVLVMNGYNDIMVPTINSYLLFQHIPNSKLILYPDSGHGFVFQYPEEVVTDILLFLNK